MRKELYRFQTSSLITLGWRVLQRKFSAIAFDRRAQEHVRKRSRHHIFSSRSGVGKCQEKQCRRGNIPVESVSTRESSPEVNYERSHAYAREEDDGGEGELREGRTRERAAKKNEEEGTKTGGGERNVRRIMRFHFRRLRERGVRARKSSSRLIPHSPLVFLSRVIISSLLISRLRFVGKRVQHCDRDYPVCQLSRYRPIESHKSIATLIESRRFVAASKIRAIHFFFFSTIVRSIIS